ncbi:MAG: NAD(P)H-dependent oxidoreductase [Alphaproteobacteria bacterium]|nr:NAD(P)H-dependent oxidoreductase [Alphaproteobacteria bacterium]
MKKIGVIVGSIAKGSINRKFAKALVKLSEKEAAFTFIEIKDLPFFSVDSEGELPASVVKFKKEIEAQDAILFVTPEYNRSIPGVLKNALDWSSRPYGQISLANKTAGIVGVSLGAIGTALAQAHLRNILAFFNMNIMGQPELYGKYKEGDITDNSEFADEGSKKFYASFMSAFLKKVN